MKVAGSLCSVRFSLSLSSCSSTTSGTVGWNAEMDCSGRGIQRHKRGFTWSLHFPVGLMFPRGVQARVVDAGVLGPALGRDLLRRRHWSPLRKQEESQSFIVARSWGKKQAKACAGSALPPRSGRRGLARPRARPPPLAPPSPRGHLDAVRTSLAAEYEKVAMSTTPMKPKPSAVLRFQCLGFAHQPPAGDHTTRTRRAGLSEDSVWGAPARG